MALLPEGKISIAKLSTPDECAGESVDAVLAKRTAVDNTVSAPT